MIRRPPRSTLDRSSAASDVYKRQVVKLGVVRNGKVINASALLSTRPAAGPTKTMMSLSLIHISEPTRPY